MVDSKQWLTWRTTNGTPFTVGTRTITPQAQALTIRWPGGGLVWNRPLALLVEEKGVSTRLPIVDPTRRWQVGLFALTLVVLVGAYLARTSRKEHTR